MTPPTKDNAPVHPATQEDNIIQQMKKANQKALDLQDQVRLIFHRLLMNIFKLSTFIDSN